MKGFIMKQQSSIGRRSFLKDSGRWALAISSALQFPGACQAQAPEVDYAQSRYVDLWLRHPVFGDPSFDAFERVPGNPIHTGAPPYGWPVNGFLFLDPVSGNWYSYIGDYATGYARPTAEPLHLIPLEESRPDVGKSRPNPGRRRTDVRQEQPHPRRQCGICGRSLPHGLRLGPS